MLCCKNFFPRVARLTNHREQVKKSCGKLSSCSRIMHANYNDNVCLETGCNLCIWVPKTPHLMLFLVCGPQKVSQVSTRVRFSLLEPDSCWQGTKAMCFDLTDGNGPTRTIDLSLLDRFFVCWGFWQVWHPCLSVSVEICKVKSYWYLIQ